jgi:hypothetical protein
VIASASHMGGRPRLLAPARRLAGQAVLSHCRGRTGAAFTSPVTLSTLLASAAGTITGRSLARSGYGPTQGVCKVPFHVAG